MDYEEISAAARCLSYRNKLRLAQLLIQLARREEETEHPASRDATLGTSEKALSAEFVAQRIRKLKPKTRKALLRSIDAMYQFQGGISQEDKQQMIDQLGNGYGIAIDRSGRVSYSD